MIRRQILESCEEPPNPLLGCPLCEAKERHPCLSVFLTLHLEDLSWLQDVSRTLCFERGQTIFAQGEPVHEIFLLCQGKVQLVRSESGANLLTRAVQFLRPGDIIGTATLLGRSFHCTSAVALEACCARFMSVGDFRDLCSRSLMFAIEVLRNVASQLERARKFVHTLLQAGSRVKVAGLLLELSNIYGKRIRDSVEIEARFTDSDLAKMIGLSREITNRQLNALKHQGLILRQDHRWTILDEGGLKQLLYEGSPGCEKMHNHL